MKTVWRKLGRLYCPRNHDRHPKLMSHAANPLPVFIEGDAYRIFYSGRDECNRSSVGAVDVDIVKGKIIFEHERPFFEHGPPNSFFANGVSIGSCYEVDGQKYMLFMGWQNPTGGHWRGDIGRLIVKDDLTLELENDKPFLSVDSVDLISLSYPWVCNRESGGYNMWYGSTIAWEAGNGEMLHTINHAFSDDGHQWTRSGQAVPYEIGRAQAFSRPTVRPNENGGYQMWFSYRGAPGMKYRIGCAASDDGRHWRLDLDNTGIDVSSDGWDSEMIEYPFVLEHKQQCYMLYNGNGYGKSGFGLAVLKA
jgi:hypothetical protein